MRKRFLVSSSPHYRARDSVRTVMLDVIIALLPVLAVSVIYFGWRALTVTIVSVACCISFETLFNFIRKKENTATDLSCDVTGILLAFCLPVTVPYWLVAAGAAFAVIVVKMLFGGRGKNFANPALAARAFLYAWPMLMTTFVSPLSGDRISIFSAQILRGGDFTEVIDSITTATPLKELKTGVMPAEGLFDIFMGNVGGCIGETCSAIIMLGGLYLLYRRVITWHIPVMYLGTVAFITLLFPLTGEIFDYEFMLAELFGGGLMLAAFFMATDYSTSPTTAKGKLIFGVGCGLLTVFFRYFGSYSEGVSYAVLLMNIFAFSLDKVTRPRRFGIGGKKYYDEKR